MIKLLIPALYVRTDFLGSIIGAVGNVVGGLIGSKSQSDTNASNAALSRENMEWMSEENVKNRDFNSAESAKTRDFNAEQSAFTRKSNAEEARLAREFNERMSNTQYQRTVSDMLAAGINPMLAVAKGPTAAPSGPAASSSAASASSASSSNTGAPALARMENSAIAAATTAQAVTNVARSIAETQNIRANKANIEAQTDNINADTEAKKAAAGLSFSRSIESTAQERKIYVEMEKLRADTIYAGTSAERNRALTRLLQLQAPRAINEAESESTWFKRNVSPFLPDLLKSSGAFKALSK